MSKKLYQIVSLILLFASPLSAEFDKTKKCSDWDRGNSYSQCLSNCVRASCDVEHRDDPNWCENHCCVSIYDKHIPKEDRWDPNYSGSPRLKNQGIVRPDNRVPDQKAFENKMNRYSAN